MLDWNSFRIEEAVAGCLAHAKALADLHGTLQGNLGRIRAILAAWASKLIVERKPSQVHRSHFFLGIQLGS